MSNGLIQQYLFSKCFKIESTYIKKLVLQLSDLNKFGIIQTQIKTRQISTEKVISTLPYGFFVKGKMLYKIV